MEYFKEQLELIKSKDQYRSLKYIQTSQDPEVMIEGKKYIIFGSNNYLGLCNDVRLKESAINAIKQYGVGSGGSRLTTGSYDVHKKLEKKIAEFKGTEDSLVFNSGYAANVGIISAVCNRDWVIFSDRYNHASIIDGCILSRAKLIRYKHCDMEDLKDKILKYKGKHNLIVTDGVFSMDGDIAPIPKIVEIAKKNNILTMVDDAHATGVLGKGGRGTASFFNLENQIDISMGTLSKAVASEGAYAAGSHEFIEYLKNKARSLIYSTSLSPAVINVSIKSLEIIEKEDFRRNDLLNMSLWLQKKLKELGFNIIETVTPIIPVIIGDSKTTLQFSNMLMEEGIYVPGIRPPTVPNGTARLRISLMATHKIEQLQQALSKIEFIGRKLGIIGDKHE